MTGLIILDNSLNQGLIYGFLALSVFISLRVIDFPDLSVEGTFPLGAAIAVACTKLWGLNWTAVFPLVLALGFTAGTLTGVLHTYLRLGKLLSGILVAIGLYSINFRVMAANSNLYLVGEQNSFYWLKEQNFKLIQTLLPDSTSVSIYPVLNFVYLLISISVIYMLLSLFKTQKGILIRFARADSKMFLESLGVNQKRYAILGLGIANALAAFSGSLVAFQEGSASINMGFGMILVALVSLVIGEQVIRVFHQDLTDIWPTIISPFVGAFLYYLIIRAVRGLNSLWQIYRGFPDPTDQLQFFNSDVRLLSVLIMVLLYIFRKKEITEINIPERL